MTDERREELAALAALGFLDEAEQRELRNAGGESGGEAGQLTREFVETWARIALEAPAVPPPARLKAEILAQLPARSREAKIIPFSQWIPYAIAACLMILGITQATQIIGLKSQLRDLQSIASSEVAQLRTNALIDLRLDNVPKAPAGQADPAYASSEVVVAWSPSQHSGEVSTENLPPAPPGSDYELWVLDPKAPAPIPEGPVSGSRSFTASSVTTPDPGFAISLEPRGGSPTVTGPILFAVAPGR